MGRIVLFLSVLVFVLLYNLEAVAEDKRDIVKIIRASAIHYGIDPEVAVAIAKTESSLNPKAIGGAGEVGLFQLHPEFHKVERGNIHNNVNVAMKYLVQVKNICEPKYKDAWLICFNLGPYYSKTIRYPTKFPYFIKVRKNILLATNKFPY